jgi:hypothetical protein
MGSHLLLDTLLHPRDGADPPIPGVQPWLIEDFSTYPDFESFVTDPRGIYLRIEDMPRPAGIDFPTDAQMIAKLSQYMALDTGVLFNGTPTMRYDWPGMETELTITRQLKLPAGTRKIWIQWYDRRPVGFFDDRTTAKKVLFIFGDTPAGGARAGRFAVNLENGLTGRLSFESSGLGGIYEGVGGWYRRGPYNSQIIDGLWHQHRMHVDIDALIAEYWLDGTKYVNITAADGVSTNATQLSTVAIGKNFNYTPVNATVEHWGEIRIWLTDPGW